MYMWYLLRFQIYKGSESKSLSKGLSPSLQTYIHLKKIQQLEIQSRNITDNNEIYISDCLIYK